MKKGKAANARHRPASWADVEKAHVEGKRQGIIETWIIVFSILRDKEGYGPKRLRRVLDCMNKRSGGIRSGYLTIADLQAALEKEETAAHSTK